MFEFYNHTARCGFSALKTFARCVKGQRTYVRQSHSISTAHSGFRKSFAYGGICGAILTTGGLAFFRSSDTANKKSPGQPSSRYASKQTMCEVRPM